MDSLKKQIDELRCNEQRKDSEIRRLKKDLRAAEDKIGRLTDAILDKIGKDKMHFSVIRYSQERHCKYD